jgi:hypothetical protein
MSNVMTSSQTIKLFVRENLKPLSGTKTILMTPYLAAEWLKWNDNNRRVSKPHVKRLVSEMKAGNWQLNGQCLIMSCDGRLLDGQHRLNAIVDADQTVVVDVRFGISPDAFTTIDEGKKRSPGDVLKIEGYANYNNLSGAAKIAIAYEDGRTQASGGADRVPTNTVILEWVKDHPEMEELTVTGNSLYLASDRMVLTGSRIAACLYLAGKIDSDDANKFFATLATGIGIKGKTDPIYALRRVLVKNKVDRLRNSSAEFEQGQVITAWNAWREGRELQAIHYSPGRSKKPLRFK